MKKNHLTITGYPLILLETMNGKQNGLKLNFIKQYFFFFASCIFKVETIWFSSGILLHWHMTTHQKYFPPTYLSMNNGTVWHTTMPSCAITGWNIYRWTLFESCSCDPDYQKETKWSQLKIFVQIIHILNLNILRKH